MRGKHEKRVPLIRKLAALIIVVGITMVVTAFALEARYYNWDRLLGKASQSEESISDPTPFETLLAERPPVNDTPIAAIPTETVLPPQPSVNHEPLENADAPEVEAEAVTYTDTDTETEETSMKTIGILKIPILDVSQNLFEGSGTEQMKYGVGHIEDTAAPGQKGNCAVSGHRPYPFRYLDTLVEDDNVFIKVDDVYFTYKVYDSFDVLPEEVWVLDDVEGEDYTLTIITCTPYLISSHRLIVRARLSDINGLTPDEYYSGTPNGAAENKTHKRKLTGPIE